MVEGAAKSLVGRRLKQTGARGRAEGVNRIAELGCLTSTAIIGTLIGRLPIDRQNPLHTRRGKN